MKSKKPTTSSSSSNSNVSLATVMKHEAAANKAASSKKFGLFEDEVDIMKQKPSTSQSSNVSRTNAWNVDPFLPDFSRPKGLSPFADEHVLQDEDFNNATPPQRQSPQSKLMLVHVLSFIYRLDSLKFQRKTIFNIYITCLKITNSPNLSFITFSLYLT